MPNADTLHHHHHRHVWLADEPVVHVSLLQLVTHVSN